MTVGDAADYAGLEAVAILLYADLAGRRVARWEDVDPDVRQVLRGKARRFIGMTAAALQEINTTTQPRGTDRAPDTDRSES